MFGNHLILYQTAKVISSLRKKNVKNTAEKKKKMRIT